MKEKALSPFGLPPTEQDLPLKGRECNCWPERRGRGRRKNYKREERKKEGRGEKLIMNNLSSELTVN